MASPSSHSGRASEQRITDGHHRDGERTNEKQKSRLPMLDTEPVPVRRLGIASPHAGLPEHVSPMELGLESDVADRRKGSIVSLFAAMDNRLDQRRMSDPGVTRKDKPSKAVSHLGKELPIPPSPPASSSRSQSNSPTVPRPESTSPTHVDSIAKPSPPSSAPRPRPLSSSPSPSPASSAPSSPVLTSVYPHHAPSSPSVKRSTSDDFILPPSGERRGSRDPTRRLSGEDQVSNKVVPASERPRSGSGSPSGGSAINLTSSVKPADKGNKIKEIWQNTKNLIGGRLSTEIDLSPSSGRSKSRSRAASVASETELIAHALVTVHSDGGPDEGESSGQDSTPSDKSGMEDTIIHHDLLLAPPIRRPNQWRSYDDSAIEQVVSDDPRLFFGALLDPVMAELEDVPLDLDLSGFDIVYDKPLPPPPPGQAAFPVESYSRPLPPLPPAAAAAPREGLFASKGYTQTTRKGSIKRGQLLEDSHVSHVSRAERRSAHLRRTGSADNILSLSNVMPAPDFAAQVQPTAGFRIETPNNSSSGALAVAHPDAPSDIPPEDPEPVYARYFVGKRHVTYIGFNNYIGYVAVSLIKEPGGYLALLRTKEGDQRVTIPAKGIRKPSDRKLLQLVNAFLTPDTLVKIPSADIELVKMLCDFDDLKVAKLKRTNTYKIGVLYVREGQTQENDFFANTQTSREFEDFLNFLGQRVPLQGFARFNGGLDVEGTSTGRHSVYTHWESSEIMFHVSTLIPLGEKGSEENQLIERKRHIGNDVVVLVFTDSHSVPFNPKVLGSHYNHVFIVVSADRRGGFGPVRYRLSVVQRDGVPAFKPPLNFPPLYDPTPATRNFLLSKIVHGELASLYAPGFRSRIISSRQKLLQVLASKYPK